jgi:arylsulfatase A-like enzyme
MQRRFNFRHDGKGEARRLDGKQATYQATRETMARTKMIRTERWKMVIRLAGGNELYDLANDPWELNNRWGEPGLAPVIQDLQLQMIEWCLRTDTDRPHQERVGA